MKLGFHLNFDDLNNLAGLNLVDGKFLKFLQQAEPAIFKTLLEMRVSPCNVNDKEYANLICDLSSYVDDFLSILFGIEQEVASFRQQASDFDIIFECKRKFVQRFALKKYSLEQLQKFDFKQVYRLVVAVKHHINLYTVVVGRSFFVKRRG